MEHLRARCPACEKLYQVETSAIYSQSPHFDCKACHSIFTFQFPPLTTDSEVVTFLVQNSAPESDIEANVGSDIGTSVILQAQPSLVQLWNHIFEDYDDHERHEDFVKRCIELEALPFAQTKYYELKSALGSDDLCDRYLAQVDARLAVKNDFQKQAQARQHENVDMKLFMIWLKARPWKKVMYWAPMAMGMVMVMAGLSNLNLRNMIGLGFAVAFLGYGLITVIFGRIHISDFID